MIYTSCKYRLKECRAVLLFSGLHKESAKIPLVIYKHAICLVMLTTYSRKGTIKLSSLWRHASMDTVLYIFSISISQSLVQGTTLYLWVASTLYLWVASTDPLLYS